MKLVVQISLALLLLGCGPTYMADQKFEYTKWQSDNNSRYSMVNDIIENDLLIAMSKKEVVQLLGSSSEKGPCSNCIGYSTYEPAQGFSLDHSVLQINFDDQDKVIEVYKNDW